MAALAYVFHAVLVVLARVCAGAIGGRREVAARRRETRITELVEAWRKLVRAGAGDLGAIDEALADIQLFGEPAQVARAAAVARDLSLRDTFIEELRRQLRDALQLDGEVAPLVHVRARSTVSAWTAATSPSSAAGPRSVGSTRPSHVLAAAALLSS